MIVSFADRHAEELFRTGKSRRWNAIATPALLKLRYLDAAAALGDLRVPPGNRLEALKGNRAGQYSIRINDQWRICFRWHQATGQAHDVEIVDYH
jgi:toxin HigB-1